MPKTKKPNAKKAAANETAAAVARHQAALDRLKLAAEVACENLDTAWDDIVGTLADNYLYIRGLRTAPDEMNAAAKAAGVKLTVRRREKPSATFLHVIYPAKARQRIHEWATALEIAHKHEWNDAELCKALVETPLKKFKKTYDPAPQKETAGKKGRRDGALAVIKLDTACDFTGRVICYGDADGNGRIKIMKVAPSDANSVDPESEAMTDTKALVTAGEDCDHQQQQPALISPVPETSADGAGAPPNPPPTTPAPSTNNARTPFEALQRLLHDDDGITTLQAAADAMNAASIATARGGVWYPASIRALIKKEGYDRITDVPSAAPDHDADPDPPPPSSAPVPPVPETSTDAKGIDVEAPPTTVPPAGNADAAVIVNDAGDDDIAGLDASANADEETAAPEQFNGRAPMISERPDANKAVIANRATKSALIAVLQVVSAIGFEAVRIEARGNEWRIWSNDGINKSVFMSGGCDIDEHIDANFALNEISGLLNALNASSEKITFEFDDVRVFKKIDPSDDNSRTIEVIERQLIKLKIGRYVHAVDHASRARKAQLRKVPAWTLTTTIDLKSSGIVDFAKFISGVRSGSDKFTATLNDDVLEFSINYDYKHSAVIPICTCEFNAHPSNHGWKIVQFKKLLKGIAALKVPSIKLSIDAATGLLMVEVNKQVGVKEAVRFEVIIPGKIGD